LQVQPAQTTQSVQTLPRLLASTKDFTELSEQIRQAAHIIGLPDNWSTTLEAEKRSDGLGVRAEWVLHWILHKLKEEGQAGIQARAYPQSWNLLDWMVRVIATSRTAIQLQEVDFLSVLEQTLQENFGVDDMTQGAQGAPDMDDVHMKDVSESSETVQEEPQPSRKRKRPSSGTSTPSKRIALQPEGLEQLFVAIAQAVGSIYHKSDTQMVTEELGNAMQMTQVLKTESAQAARLLKLWYMAVSKLMVTRPNTTTMLAILDLSTISKIWNLRMVDPKDNTKASAEQFSTECLIPTLILQDELCNEVDAVASSPETASALRKALRCVEDLLAYHLLKPSRTSFHIEAAAVSRDAKVPGNHPQAEQFSSNLEPLQAKLLSAAQIQDAGAHLPKPLLRLYNSIPRLLELAIQNSRSRTLREKTGERPWIQSAFRALVECAGCSFEIPEFLIPKASIRALERSLKILQVNHVDIDSNVFADVFWFHSGVKFPLTKKRRVQWPLIAALVEIDADLFLTKANIGKASTGRPDDLTDFLFDQISSMSDAELTGLADLEMIDDASVESVERSYDQPTGNFAILKAIVVPIMSAFARNRDLLGFVRRWDSQLRKNAPINRSSQRQAESSIWQHAVLASEFSRLFEQSLTQTQILSLFQHHISRTLDFKTAHDSSQDATDLASKVFASANLLRVMLAATTRDETVEILEHELQALFKSCDSLLQDEWYRSHTDLSSFWMMLSSLVAILWPLQLHTSAESQTQLLLPLMEQAVHDATSVHKSRDTKSVDSKTRAAAFLFVCNSCNWLQSTPEWHELTHRAFRKALKTLSSSRLETKDLSSMVETFCSEFVHLLDLLETESREASLLKLLTQISNLHETAGEVAEEMSECISTAGTASLREAYSVALTKAFDDKKHKSLRATAQLAALQIRPKEMSRERREALLNKLSNMINAQPEDAALFLSVMNTLMEAPNSTARISSDGGALFEISQTLHDRDCEDHTVMRLFERLVLQTLRHIFSNPDQAQNKQFFESFRKFLLANSSSKHCYPAMLAMYSASFGAQKDFSIISWEQYLEFLGHSTKSGMVPNVQLLEAYNEVSDNDITEHEEIFSGMQSSLREWFGSHKKFKHLFKGNDFASAPVLQEKDCVGLLIAGIVKYHLHPSSEWLVELAVSIAKEAKGTENGKQRLDFITSSLQRAVASLPVAEKLTLVALVTKTESRENAYPFLHPLILSLPDKLPDDDEQKPQLLSLIPKLCRLLTDPVNSTATFTTLMTSIDTILRDKPAITSQQSIEYVLTALETLSSPRSPPLSSAHAQAIYARLCEVARTILLLHRSRLGGRFHLLLPLLQNLLLCLFIPNAGRGTILPPWLKNSGVRLSHSNAAQYAKLLSTLCSPTQSSVSKHRTNNSTFSSSSSNKNTKASLNDPVKAAREYASHYLYPLLTSFCRYQLFGRLEPDVRDKLMPGVWEVIGTASLDKESLQAMFAGASRETRDVWRGVWEEWGRVGGGRGGRW
jgi:nucleolar pre-ribosomal-associated protein 2